MSIFAAILVVSQAAEIAVIVFTSFRVSIPCLKMQRAGMPAP